MNFECSAETSECVRCILPSDIQLFSFYFYVESNYVMLSNY